MKWMKAEYINHDICPRCTYGVLRDEIKFGAIYEVDIERIALADFTCGGCKYETRGIFIIWTRTNSEGYLPLGLFKIRKDLQ